MQRISAEMLAESGALALGIGEFKRDY